MQNQQKLWRHLRPKVFQISKSPKDPITYELTNHVRTTTPLNILCSANSTLRARRSRIRLRHPSNFPHRRYLSHAQICSKLVLSASFTFMPGIVMSCACLVATIDAGENRTVWFTAGLAMRFKALPSACIAIENSSCRQSVIYKLKWGSIIRECIF